jgi:hypothetical protein
MWWKKIGAVISTVFCILVPFEQAQGQDPMSVLGVAATSEIAGWTIKKILSDIQEKLDATLKNAESSGNRLLGSAAEQSYIMLKQLNEILDKQREMTFQQLSNERKLAIWDLYTLSIKLREGVADDFAKDTVQVHKLLAQIRFLGKDVEFLIVRIGPPILVKANLAHDPIRIFGVGFGTDQADKKFEIKIKLNGRDLNPDRISIKEWGVELFLLYDDIAAAWKQNEYARVAMVIEATTISRGPFWCAHFGCHSREKHLATYHFTLYPTNSADLVIKQVGETPTPAGDPQITYPGIDLPNMHNPDHDAVTTGPLWYAGENWIWVRHEPGRDQCRNIGGNGCPFVNSPRCLFINDNTQAQCTVNNTGASVTYLFGLVKQKYEKKAVPMPDSKFSLLPGVTQRVEFDRAAATAWLEGTLPDGKLIGPIALKPAGGSATQDIMCTSAGEVGSKAIFDCTMRDVW